MPVILDLSSDDINKKLNLVKRRLSKTHAYYKGTIVAHSIHQTNLFDVCIYFSYEDTYNKTQLVNDEFSQLRESHLRLKIIEKTEGGYHTP